MDLSQQSLTAKALSLRHLYIVLGLAWALVLIIALTLQDPKGWLAVISVVPVCYCAWKYRRHYRLERHHQLIAARLERLPDDFVIMHNVKVLAPWAKLRLDHLILSRFGLVIVTDGPSPAVMHEHVEAVRYLLTTTGLVTTQVPIRSLILLAPGLVVRSQGGDTPVVGVEQVRLDHVAPSKTPVLSNEQVENITFLLTQLQRVA